MTTGQIVAWLLGALVFISLGWLYSLAMRRAKRLQKQIDDAKKEYERFKSQTVPCDKCLGTGRAPKEGRSWPDGSIACFRKDVELENIPKQFRDAFKD